MAGKHNGYLVLSQIPIGSKEPRLSGHREVLKVACVCTRLDFLLHL